MIIQRYLFREIFQVFLAVLAILLLIYVSNRFVGYLTDAAAGKISSELIFELLALKLLEKLVILLPLGLYIAILLALGRLYKDNEIVAMVSGGIGISTLAQGIFWMSLVMAGVAMVLSLYVAPQVATIQADTLARAKEESEITGLYPGRFRVFRDGNLTVYVEQVAPDGASYHNVFVQMRKRGRDSVLVSDLAYQVVEGPEARRYIVLEDGYRYVGSPGDVDYVITEFEKHAVLLDHGDARPGFRRQEVFATMELVNSDNLNYIAELQWRVSLPITVVVLAMLAIPLSRTSPRQGKYAKLFTAILFYFIYNLTIGVFRKLIERGDVPPVIGIWPVHLAMVAVVLAYFLAQSAAPGFVSRYIHQLRQRA